MPNWPALSLRSLSGLQPTLPPLVCASPYEDADEPRGLRRPNLQPRPKTTVMAFVISAIPKDLQRPAGQLHTIKLPLVMGRLKRQLIRHELGPLPFVAGVDFSYNEDSEQRYEPHWQIHFWIYAVGPMVKLEKDGLTRFFPADGTIPVPVMVKSVTDPIEGISYLWKSVFFRRVTYLAPNGRFNSRKVALKPNQERELRICLDHYAPTDRLCLNGLQRRGCRYEWAGRFVE